MTDDSRHPALAPLLPGDDVTPIPEPVIGDPLDLGITGVDLYEATQPAAYADADNDYAWRRFVGALSVLLDNVADVCRSFDGEERWTQLASPSRCPPEWLPVLAQWAGVRRPDAMTEAELRELIGPTAPGMWRGTRAAMIAAVRRFLPQPLDPNTYRDLVMADRPAAYWQLGERPGETIAADVVASRLSGTYAGAQTPNLVRNPSLEADLSHWVGTSTTALSRVTDRAWAGAASAHISRTPSEGTYSECAMALNVTGVSAVPVRGGESYTLTAAIYPISLLDPQRPWLSFIWYDAAGVQITQATAGITDATPLNAWTRISATRVAPENARFLRYYVGLYSGNIGDGTTVVEGHVDGVQLTQTGAIVPYSDTQAITLGQIGAIASSGNTALHVGGSVPTSQASFMSVPYSLFLYAETFTLEAWVRIVPGASGQTVWSAAWSPGGHLVRLEPNGAIVFFVHRTDETSDYTSQSTPPGVIHGQTYQHIVCTVEADMRQRIYIDGVLRATSASPLPSISVPTGGTLYVGGHYSHTIGFVDEPAIYTHALTAERVAAHYATGRQISPPNPDTALYFEERADGNPYLLRVFTYSFVDHDPEQVRAALEAAKPAGLTLIYEVRQGQTWAMLRNRGFSWAEVNNNYASWHAVLTDEPTSQET